MDRERLFELLEIDDPADLDYFEQFAELIECDEYIDSELFAEALSGIRAESAGEITENYMEELSKHLPDNGDDLFALVDQIEDRLLMLAADIDDDPSARSRFAEELFRFREWYNDPDGAKVDGKPCSIRDAVTSAREEKLGAEKKSYDFSASLGYELKELSMGLGSYRKVDVVDDPEEEGL